MVRHPIAVFRRGVVIKGILLAVFVLGVQWMLIHRYSGESPFGDQWNAEAEQIYIPILRGEWHWTDLFLPANEHRIVPTRFLDVLLFRATGYQWDPKVQIVASGVLHAMWLGVLGAWLMRRLSPAVHSWITLGIAIVGSVPLAYENFLWGFQSQFYFLFLFSTLAGWGLLGYRPNRIGWWVGLAAGFLATVSMGSGAVSGVAVLAVIGLRVIKARHLSGGGGMTAVAALALISLGMMLRVEVAGHTNLGTHSWGDFSLAFWRLLAWPFSSMLFAGVIIWLPIFTIALRWLRSERRTSVVEERILYIAVFVIGQLAALAWMRGAPLTFTAPSSRYLDVLLLGLLVNIAACVIWVGSANRTVMTRYLAAGWGAVALSGVCGLSLETASDSLRGWRDGCRLETARLALFFRTGAAAPLQANDTWDHAASVLTKIGETLHASLPPALQSRPLNGFGFDSATGIVEGDLPAELNAPGGYAMWSNHAASKKSSANVIATSTPFEARGAAVTLLYALSLDWGPCSLQLIAADGEIAAEIFPGQIPRGAPNWEERIVTVPLGQYRLRIRDERGKGWVAVSSPRIMSRLGAWVRVLLAQGGRIAVVAAVGLAISALANFPKNRWREKRPI